MCGNNDSGNSMPESGKAAQAVECLADIRKRSGTSSGILVFKSEQRDGGNEQGRLLKRGCAGSKNGDVPLLCRRKSRFLEDVLVELPDTAWLQTAAPGSFGAPSTGLGISPAGSHARMTAQLRLYLAPIVARCRSG